MRREGRSSTLLLGSRKRPMTANLMPATNCWTRFKLASIPWWRQKTCSQHPFLVPPQCAYSYVHKQGAIHSHRALGSSSSVEKIRVNSISWWPIESVENTRSVELWCAVADTVLLHHIWQIFRNFKSELTIKSAVPGCNATAIIYCIIFRWTHRSHFEYIRVTKMPTRFVPIVY